METTTVMLKCYLLRRLNWINKLKWVLSLRPFKLKTWKKLNGRATHQKIHTKWKYIQWVRYHRRWYYYKQEDVNVVSPFHRLGLLLQGALRGCWTPHQIIGPVGWCEGLAMVCLHESVSDLVYLRQGENEMKPYLRKVVHTSYNEERPGR